MNDGVNTYTYDSANRLTAVSGPSSVVEYSYSGLGDRLQQTVDGSTTNYVLDLNAGLTQVLDDGTNTYLYGNGRIAQTGTATEYFLGDALGSVRQLTNEAAEITLTKAYEPYGEEAWSYGEGQSAFAFTGEQVDVNGLVYLRARYYASYLNQFIQPDTIVPDPRIPADWNRYAYVRNNPVNFTDPSGKSPVPDAEYEACISYLAGSTIKGEACNMISELEDKGYLIQMPDIDHITQGNRDQREAHKFSTAYHILHDFVSIEDLRKTPKDMDNITWYKEEWDIFYCNSIVSSYSDPAINMVSRGYLAYLIKKNASDIAKDIQIGGRWSGTIYTPFGSMPDVSYAMEGYEQGDPKRLPNSTLPGVSKHTYGQAVDIGRIQTQNGKPADIPESKVQIWKLPNSDVDKIARNSGLRRPLNGNYAWYTDDEPSVFWHFEPLWVKE